MKATGITRRLDNLGRIVIPIEMRKNLDIDIKDPVDISAEKDCIILKKHMVSCTFCGSEASLTEFGGRLICRQCLDQLKKLNG